MFISMNIGKANARPVSGMVPRRPTYQDSATPTAVCASVKTILRAAGHARAGELAAPGGLVMSSYGLVLPRPRVIPFSSLLRGSGVRVLVSARAQTGESSV